MTKMQAMWLLFLHTPFISDENQEEHTFRNKGVVLVNLNPEGSGRVGEWENYSAASYLEVSRGCR